MSASGFNSVIDAIDTLIDEEVEDAAVRFAPSTLSDQDIEDFITATLARGEDGTGPATTVAAPPVPVTPVRPAPRRYARRRVIEPRPNRYAATCRACRTTVAAGEGVLTRERGAWAVQHNECPPTLAPAPVRTPRPAPRRTRAAAPAKATTDSDCYVVTVEVEVVADGVGSAREAALLALREVFSGEVAVTVTTPGEAQVEVNM